MYPETKKGKNWEKFADDVLVHVETYTVPQYGDTGNDRVDEYSIHDCKKTIERYLARIGRNARPGQDKIDMMKIAHYASFIYDKIGKKDDKSTEVG